MSHHPSLIRNTGPLYVPRPPFLARWIANRRADWRTLRMFVRQVVAWPTHWTWFAIAAIAAGVIAALLQAMGWAE